ncbi:MAG TPA: hypothetical protein VMU05_16705 [Dongiaceae bacterium]|nr:hypothetical protein [Dongiaceae bacterium]
MSRWNIKASTLIILSCLIVIMLLIVVLPDVDLPDTAFHQGTAPLVIHARARITPAAVAVSAAFLLPRSTEDWRPDRDIELLAGNIDPNFRPILLRSIRR